MSDDLVRKRDWYSCACQIEDDGGEPRIIKACLFHKEMADEIERLRTLVVRAEGKAAEHWDLVCSLACALEAAQDALSAEGKFLPTVERALEDAYSMGFMQGGDGQ